MIPALFVLEKGDSVFYLLFRNPFWSDASGVRGLHAEKLVGVGRGMKLSIYYYKDLERPWLMKRVGGSYEQHAHFYTKKDAVKVRELIDAWRYPYSKSYKIAMQRLLTEEEFKSLNKKPRCRKDHGRR